MKRFICIAIGIGLFTPLSAQELIQDEAQQARVHFMNEAKVSYIASAEMHQAMAPVNDEIEIPEDIKTAFKDRYKGAKKVEWVIKEDRYKVNFEYKGQEMFTYLDRHGLWIKSFTRLAQEDLPDAVTTFLQSEYPDYSLTKFYLKDTPDGQSYTVAAKGKNEYVWLEFDEKGQLLNSPAS